MTALARMGNRVLFVENTGVRSPRLRDVPRLGGRLGNWTRAAGGFRQECENLWVHSPLLLPFPYSRMAGRINRALLGRALGRWMRRNGFGRPVVWTFLPTPLARDVIRDLDPLLTLYYCIDDLASSSPAARAVRGSEEDLLRDADLVFVTSGKLRARAARFRERVYQFPFGVDFEAFERARRCPDELPVELRGLGRPLVGYVGGVHQWVDQELLVDVTERLPSANFVFIGPPQTDLSALARRTSVHFLGPRPHADLPRYIKAFDVGIIPYRLCEYTEHVYPTKLNEYLAMGVPVVATDLPEIRHVNAEHPGLLAIARDPGAFAQALCRAAESRTGPETLRRINVARENAWSGRIRAMLQVVAEALERKALPADSRELERELA